MFISVYVNRNRMYIIGHKGSILYTQACVLLHWNFRFQRLCQLAFSVTIKCWLNYVCFRSSNVVIGHNVLLQKTRWHMQLWMLIACSEYLRSFRQRLPKKVFTESFIPISGQTIDLWLCCISFFSTFETLLHWLVKFLFPLV
jgi:hypothetical protein